jgi:hypothetical protein
MEQHHNRRMRVWHLRYIRMPQGTYAGTHARAAYATANTGAYAGTHADIADTSAITL